MAVSESTTTAAAAVKPPLYGRNSSLWQYKCFAINLSDKVHQKRRFGMNKKEGENDET